MLLDSLSNLGGFATCRSIIATHYTLNASELNYSARHQVSLAKTSSALNIAKILTSKTGIFRKVICQALDTVSLVEHGAQLFLEDHFAQMINVRLKRLFQVFVIEELRVIKASTNNTLVAIDDGFGASRVAIAYHNKTIGKLAILVIQREITLVNQHGINDDFFGNF